MKTNEQNIINIIGINTVSFIKGRKGQFRAVVKTKAGYLTIVDFHKWDHERYSNNPASILDSFNKGSLQTVEFKPEGDNNSWLTIFARKGKKIVVIDQDILRNLKVGTINPMFHDTNLYSQEQYKAVNAQTWDSYGFIMNVTEK